MRTIPEGISAQLALGVTTLAHVWRITRRDGEIFGFTDHDRPLAFDGLTCEPALGLSVGAIEKSVGLGVDTASISGALSSEAITETDLARGLWDGALVELFRVDWREPGARVHLFSGRIGEVRRGGSVFEAELRGLQAALNKPRGRVFSRYCDAMLGDGRCGKDVETAAFRGEGVVSRIIGTHAFAATGLDAFEEGWFSRGRVAIGDVSAEIAAHSVADGEVIFELLDVLGDALEIGAECVAYAGCDKRFQTCRTKFENGANFRGFPHMPGNDLIQSGPIAGQPMDGGSRNS
jgi:uncharacterized phage protein (TIGR02218 family)